MVEGSLEKEKEMKKLDKVSVNKSVNKLLKEVSVNSSVNRLLTGVTETRFCYGPVLLKEVCEDVF
ncbi:hypothetical protein [Archaeoglobus profundus]|uniref:Uncharacterized protein n=1 Tax=Archaeoglobus profundus (strain DSM 5631 / JCM 9629 / NBRC 100127 / Av18) TaxID=572546 RepID=D2RF95_ARCPA|nr:hypothetical protein [Archaeoglobus profundus]ADB58789.1 hypothetical protein Arcpr_1745 [Archaeoglobus profundus DSM 5631]